MPHDGSHPLTWEVTLWGRHIRCHQLDQHFYLEERFLALTPIEFGLFWLLLQQTLRAQIWANSARGPAVADEVCASHLSPGESYTSWDCYLQQVGIVPIDRLLEAVTGDPRHSNRKAARHDSGLGCSPRSSVAEYRSSYRGRASLTSHLDRLRQKLRCHGLDVGTVLLFGRAAQGYLLFPLVDDPAGGR